MDKISLLDYFAGVALQGFLANGGIRGHSDGTGDAKDNAIWAYEYAQAMIEQRKSFNPFKDKILIEKIKTQ